MWQVCSTRTGNCRSSRAYGIGVAVSSICIWRFSEAPSADKIVVAFFSRTLTLALHLFWRNTGGIGVPVLGGVFVAGSKLLMSAVTTNIRWVFVAPTKRESMFTPIS